MNEIILSPNANFIDSRNPSSPFAYKQAMIKAVWDAIMKKSWVQFDTISIRINDIYYFANTNAELFEQIKHHWGL